MKRRPGRLAIVSGKRWWRLSSIAVVVPGAVKVDLVSLMASNSKSYASASFQW